jgi:hypothetical protein
MPAAMNDAEDHDLLLHHAVKHGIGKTLEDLAARLSMHAWIRERTFRNRRDGVLRRCPEPTPEPWSMRLVPVPRLYQLCLGFWA